MSFLERSCFTWSICGTQKASELMLDEGPQNAAFDALTPHFSVPSTACTHAVQPKSDTRRLKCRISALNELTDLGKKKKAAEFMQI